MFYLVSAVQTATGRGAENGGLRDSRGSTSSVRLSLEDFINQ